MFDHGTLSALAFPSDLRPRTPDSQGFQKPVPISVPAQESAQAAKPLSTFLPLSSIGRWAPKFDMNDELARLLDGTRVSPRVRCYLSPAWRFEQMEADSWKRSGHEYAGLAHRSIAEIIVKALYDLEGSLDQLHPQLSNSARADFWRSWQIDDHLARFCSMVARSGEAEALARESFCVVNEVNQARNWVYLQLELYATDLRATSPSVPAAEPSREEPSPQVLDKVVHSPSIQTIVDQTTIAPISDSPTPEPELAVTPKTPGDPGQPLSADARSGQSIRSRRHGFIAAMPRHEAIAKIVERHAPNWRTDCGAWRKDSILDSICADLDADKISIIDNWKVGKTASLKGQKLRDWCDALDICGKKLVADQIRTSLSAVLKIELNKQISGEPNQ